MSASSPFQPTQADLTANRAGRLADSQGATLQRQIRMTRWVSLGFCALFVGLAVLFTVGIYSEIGADGPLFVIVAMDIFLLLMTLPIIWRMRRDIRKIREDLADGRVAAYQGKPSLGYKRATIWIAGNQLPLPRSLNDFDWNAHYTVYVGPRSRAVVAIEKSASP